MGLSNAGVLSDNLSGEFVSSVVNVSTTATELKVGAARLVGRQQVILHNDGSEVVYLGPSGVSSSGSTKGIPLEPGQTDFYPYTDSFGVFAITASGSTDIIVQELS